MTLYPEYPERFTVGGQNNGLVGALLDSAVVSDTFAITNKIHMVTGTGTVSTLTPPWPTFAGTVYLIGDGTWAIDTNGNVAIAITGKVNIAVGLVYNPVTAKWYPIADAVAD